MKLQSSIAVVAALLIVAAALGFWYTRSSTPPPVVVEAVPSPPAAAETEMPPVPRYPVSPPVTAPTGSVELAPLPNLSDSDAYFAIEVVELFGNDMGDLLVDGQLIEKIVTTVDNLPRAQVAEKVRPLLPLAGSFMADGQDGSGQYTENPANYARYDALIGLLAVVDIQRLAESYRRFYPLFQEAYVNLGYPDRHFNDRLVEVIDHLLLTPDVEAPLELVRPHVLYEFADPELEALSSGQKLLLRTGRDHRERVTRFLAGLRTAIVGN